MQLVMEFGLHFPNLGLGRVFGYNRTLKRKYRAQAAYNLRDFELRGHRHMAIVKLVFAHKIKYLTLPYKAAFGNIYVYTPWVAETRRK